MVSNFLKKYYRSFVFLIFLLLLSFLYNYHHILSFRPYSIHQWRQCDCLSITMNYFKEHRGFFQPAIYWLGDKEGKTVSECPLIYYSVAQLWKLFGFHEFIFRMINILIVFTGLFCLFQMILFFIKNTLWSLVLTFLVFTSPILIFYTNNFTSDAPSFGFALIATFFIAKGYYQQKKNYYYWSFLFFLLAGLIKISSLIIFIAIFTVHLYSILFTKIRKPSWVYKWYNLLPYFIVIILISSWYRFAIHYNKENISGIFLTNIYPIWKVDSLIRHNIWDSLTLNLLPEYFNIAGLYFTLLIFISNFFFFKKINKLLFFVNILVFVGVILYMLLFYQAFTVHDYYLINLLIILPVTYLTFFEMLKRNYPRILNMKIVNVIFCLLFVFLIYKSAVINRMKYSVKDIFVKTNFAVNHYTIDYWAWYHNDYLTHYKAFETITPYLRSIGIKPNQRVLSLPDNSPNITLYLMDQKGYSGYGFNELPIDKKLVYCQKNDIRYLIIDSTLNKKEYLQPFLNHRIGRYKNIDIYDLLASH